MRLTQHGTIRYGNYGVRHTDDGRWMVSRKGILVGYCDALSEVESLVETHRYAVIARVEAAERASRAHVKQRKDDVAMIRNASKKETA